MAEGCREGYREHMDRLEREHAWVDRVGPKCPHPGCGYSGPRSAQIFLRGLAGLGGPTLAGVEVMRCGSCGELARRANLKDDLRDWEALVTQSRADKLSARPDSLEESGTGTSKSIRAIADRVDATRRALEDLVGLMDRSGFRSGFIRAKAAVLVHELRMTMVLIGAVRIGVEGEPGVREEPNDGPEVDTRGVD